MIMFPHCTFLVCHSPFLISLIYLNTFIGSCDCPHILPAFSTSDYHDGLSCCIKANPSLIRSNSMLSRFHASFTDCLIQLIQP